MPEEEEKIMSKRKRKNLITLGLLLVALAVLCGVYFWYSDRAKKKQEQEETPKIDLIDIDTEQISSMHYVKDDADIILVKQDDVWISQSEPDRPIKQSNVTNILNAIKSIKADRIVTENPDNLADF